MKRSAAAIFIVSILTGSCIHKSNEPFSRVTVDNEKVKVTEYTGDPTGEVCGHGIHKHGPHLTTLLTDGDVVETIAGKAVKMHVYKGLSFWSNGETHSVVNIGNSAVKSIIVEIKNQK